MDYYPPGAVVVVIVW